MRPSFYTSNGSGSFPQRQEGRAPSQKSILPGFCLYLFLCFCLGLGLGLGVGLGLNPAFGLSLGLGLGTGLSVRLSRSLGMSQGASLDTANQESTHNDAVEDGFMESAVDVTNENVDQVSDAMEINKYEYENWEDAPEDVGGENVEEAAEENEQDDLKT